MTATVQLVPLQVGTITLPTSFFLDGETGTTVAPVTAHLVVHPNRGLALFDTGLGARFARPAGTPATTEVDLQDDGLVDACIAAAGHDPARVSVVVNSHLHSDHAGGNSRLTGARVVVQAAEWHHASGTADPAYHRPEFDTGQPVELVDGVHDVFGDGSLVLHPTPGHTPGHQSALVTTADGTAVLAGDACNLLAALDGLRLPDHVHDADAYRRSLRWFADQRAGGRTVFPSHDPAFWAGVHPGIPWRGPAT